MIQRAITGAANTVDNGPLWCIANESPPPGHMWRVIALGVTGFLMDSAINPSLPVSGCFVVPKNSPPETLNDVNVSTTSAMARLMARRYMPISMNIQSPQSGAFPGGGNAGTGNPNYLLAAELSEITMVPEQNTILAVFLSNIGQAVPGPGAGSNCIMIGLVLEGRPEEFAK